MEFDRPGEMSPDNDNWWSTSTVKKTFKPLYLSLLVTGDEFDEKGDETLRDAYLSRHASNRVPFWGLFLESPENFSDPKSHS